MNDKLKRAIWVIFYYLLFRFSPTPFHGWRRFLLRCWGAKIGHGAHVYPSAKIWAPWKLRMESLSCIGPWVDCYNVSTVTLKSRAVVSQYTFLCTASHDYQSEMRPLVSGPITVGEKSWIAAGVFLGPDVTIGSNSVVLARATVVNNIPDNEVWQGPVAKRKRKKDHEQSNTMILVATQFLTSNISLLLLIFIAILRNQLKLRVIIALILLLAIVFCHATFTGWEHPSYVYFAELKPLVLLSAIIFKVNHKHLALLNLSIRPIPIIKFVEHFSILFFFISISYMFFNYTQNKPIFRSFDYSPIHNDFLSTYASVCSCIILIILKNNYLRFLQFINLFIIGSGVGFAGLIVFLAFARGNAFLKLVFGLICIGLLLNSQTMKGHSISLDGLKDHTRYVIASSYVQNLSLGRFFWGAGLGTPLSEDFIGDLSRSDVAEYIRSESGNGIVYSMILHSDILRLLHVYGFFGLVLYLFLVHFIFRYDYRLFFSIFMMAMIGGVFFNTLAVFVLFLAGSLAPIVNPRFR